MTHIFDPESGPIVFFKSMKMNDPNCPLCRGTGFYSQTCNMCAGAGQKYDSQYNYFVACFTCQRSGWISHSCGCYRSYQDSPSSAVCMACNSTGSYLVINQKQVKCTGCCGKGENLSNICRFCQGTKFHCESKNKIMRGKHTISKSIWYRLLYCFEEELEDCKCLCKNCSGTGKKETRVKCDRCKGKGYEFRTIWETVKCYRCP